MRAVVYNGPRDVAVQDVPDAKIEKPTDALVRITSTNICGSDLHTEWVDQEVVVDQGLVTSRKLDDIRAFNPQVIKLFASGLGRSRRAAAE